MSHYSSAIVVVSGIDFFRRARSCGNGEHPMVVESFAPQYHGMRPIFARGRVEERGKLQQEDVYVQDFQEQAV